MNEPNDIIRTGLTDGEKFWLAVDALATQSRRYGWDSLDMHRFADTLTDGDRQRAHEMIQQADIKKGEW